MAVEASQILDVRKEHDEWSQQTKCRRIGCKAHSAHPPDYKSYPWMVLAVLDAPKLHAEREFSDDVEGQQLQPHSHVDILALLGLLVELLDKAIDMLGEFSFLAVNCSL
jgi:hypothetical protein